MTIADILQRITERRRERLETELGTVGKVPMLAPASSTVPLRTSPFLDAIRSKRSRAVIAEIKMGSPSLGALSGRVDPLRQAKAYAAGGAAALSVVVEPDFFFGSFELLAACKETCGLPAVAKDFLVHPGQLEQAVGSGADAVLLIAALYDRQALWAWADLARESGLVPLIETHSAADAEMLEGRDWELVGVNNRDLRTFRVDLDHSIAQVRRLPKKAFKVAESGIHDRGDVERLAKAGFDAFLVGESLLLADDPEARLRELVSW